jgi:hypothetical protein
LRIQFTKLYEICANKDIMVAECAAADWQIQFQRELSPEARTEWKMMQNMLLGSPSHQKMIRSAGG